MEKFPGSLRMEEVLRKALTRGVLWTEGIPGVKRVKTSSRPRVEVDLGAWDPCPLRISGTSLRWERSGVVPIRVRTTPHGTRPRRGRGAPGVCSLTKEYRRLQRGLALNAKVSSII